MCELNGHLILVYFFSAEHNLEIDGEKWRGVAKSVIMVWTERQKNEDLMVVFIEGVCSGCFQESVIHRLYCEK